MDYYSSLFASKLNGGGGGGGGGITPEIKQALLACFSKVAWVDEHGQDYWDTLQSALYQTASLSSITATYTQSGTVYDTDSLDSLKTDLVVTANWSDGSTSTVDSNYYTLSGTLTAGTSTITVTYLEKTTTFSVTVTQDTKVLTYHWDFTGANPLVDKVSSKTITESGTITYDSTNGLTFGTASSYLNMGLTASELVGCEVEIAFGSMVNTTNASSHQRLFVYGAQYGLICRNTGHKWSIYGSLSGTNTWQETTIAQNDVANKTVKLVFNSLADIDIYLDGSIVLEGASANNSGNVWLGSNATSATYVTVKSLKVYTLGE